MHFRNTQTTPPGTQYYPSGGIPYGGIYPAATTNCCAPIQFIKSLKWQIQLSQTTDTRIWMGLSNGIAISDWITDVPNYAIVGFRYSTNAGDTKWMCATQTDSSHSTINAETTPSHVDTGIHVFELQFDGTFVNFFIDGTQVGSQNGNLPIVSTGLSPFVLVNSVSGSNGIKLTVFGAAALGNY